MKKLLCIVIALFGNESFLVGQDVAAEPEASVEDLPRIPATSPVKALETFEVLDGYRLDLVAHEPLVMDPIAVTFDEDGAMFAIEMRGYSERRDDELGRVKKLVDTDGDGVYDEAVIFADGLKWPTAITCYKGGVFVGATPDLFYFKDTNGDGKADEKRVVLKGFGPPADQMRVNMQALFNSLHWGPDNRIWGASSRNGGQVAGVNLRGADFSFDPEKMDVRPENGVGQNGMDFDEAGNRYVCSNSNHIVRVMWEREWTKPNPFYSLPPALVSIADDGQAAPVFRISADEPWRIVRTRWRVAGVVKGVVEGGGRVSGYFTSATGITIYKGGAMPDSRGMAFIGDVGSNLVHRKKIVSENGRVQPVATRVDQDIEIIASSDNWFRPANFANAPDGSLYIVDMYRETIEHPWSIPEGIKKHLDLNSGNDMGRIYRLSASDWSREPVEKLGGKTSAELKEIAGNGTNSWQKTTARRLLYERGEQMAFERETTPFLEALRWGKIDTAAPGKVDALRELAKEAGSDRWMIAAVVNATDSLAEAEAVFQAGSDDLKIEVARLMGKSDWEGGVAMLVAREASLPVWAAYSAGGKGPSEIVEQAGEVLEAAENVISDVNATSEDRVTAFEFLANLGQLDAQQLSEVLKAKDNAISFRVMAFDAFSKSDPATLASLLVDSWSDLPPELKSRAIPFLVFPEKDRAKILLEAVKSGVVAKTEIPPDQAEKLRNHSSKGVTAFAREILPAPKIVKRADVVTKYQAALKLKGDVAKGKLAYQKACMICHQSPDGQGFAVGPDFATFKAAGADSLLKNIFDPNAEIAPQYQSYQFTLNDGTQLVGMIARENQTEVTIRAAGGQEQTFPRTRVTSMKGLGISLMPEGLEATLTIEEVADLLAYITKG